MSLKNTSHIIQIDKELTYVYLSYYNTIMIPETSLIIPPSVNQNGVSRKIHTLSTVTTGVFTYSHERVSLFSTQNLVRSFPDKKEQFGPLPATPVLFSFLNGIKFQKKYSRVL